VAYCINFDIEYICRQRGGEHLCMVSLIIAHNGSEDIRSGNSD